MLNFMIQDFYKVHINAHSTLFLSSSMIHDLYQVKVFCNFHHTISLFHFMIHVHVLCVVSIILLPDVMIHGLYTFKSYVTHYILLMLNVMIRTWFISSSNLFL